MRCPGCGLYHPSQYDNCISCGVKLDGSVEEADSANRPTDGGESASSNSGNGNNMKAVDTPHKRRSAHIKHHSKAAIPTMAGVVTAVFILLVFAGATVFFLTRTPDDERLITKGREELSRDQFAFAVETLTKAVKAKPDDPRVHLLLARAYVGISDVDKAWASISQAQQLGKGVVEEPDLASDLANYYMKRQQYAKAIDLLRPLAKAGLGNKKSELADLDAAYGDSLLAKGDLEGALRVWEEVKLLQAGSRGGEAESRLTTIYEKLAIKLSGEKKDDAAISYLSKLTSIAKNPKHYLSMADIYERNGKLDLAIEQLRKANEMSASADLQKRLSGLLAKRGKELLDMGNNDVGLAYLQQARSLDASNVVPDVTLRAIDTGLDSTTRMPRIQGEVWNPTDKPIGKLAIRAELYDVKNDRSLWARDQKIVDEFDRPLGSRRSKPFSFVSGIPARYDGSTEFRMYIDGGLYKSYLLEKKSGSILDDSAALSTTTTTPTKAPDAVKTPPPATAPPIVSGDAPAPASTTPAPAPGNTSTTTTSTTTPSAPTPPETPPAQDSGSGASSPEEKTLKDLGF